MTQAAVRVRPGFCSSFPMLFLLNNVMLSVDMAAMTPPLSGDQFARLPLSFVGKLGQELFAANPLLHLKDHEKARRLAALITAKAPTINAALFIAPARGCLVEHVQVRYATLSVEIVAALVERQKAGALNSTEADRQVWSRLAA